MRNRSTILRAVAVVAGLAISGCFSQPKNMAAAAPADGAAASGGAGGGSLSTSSVNWSGTDKVSVQDKAVGMRAYTLDIPAGWHYAGMILRPRGCHAPATPAQGLSFSAVGPDGVTAYATLPGVTWDWQSDGKSPQGPRCQPVNITTAAAFLLNIAIPNMRPDARNVAIVPLPAQMQAGLEAKQRQLQGQAGPNGRLILDSARVRLEYQLNGRPVEELLGTVIQCTETNFPAYPQMHRPAMTRRSCQSFGTNLRRAPKGLLDGMISKNLPPPQIDQAWDQHISQNMRNSFAAWQKTNNDQFQAIQDHYKQVTQGMLKRGRDFQAQQQDQTDHAMAQDRATQAAIDKGAQQQIKDSLNRQDFIDPNTGRKIETSNQYSHNWINSSGTGVVLGDDPTADPNGVVDPVRESWAELVPIP